MNTMQRKIETVSGYEYETMLCDCVDSIKLSMNADGIAESLFEDVQRLGLAIGFEVNSKTYETPCTDFAIEALPKLKRRARNAINSKAGRLLLSHCLTAETYLPDGSTITMAILPPAADGNDHFKKTVTEVFSKLPRYAQERVTDVLFLQLHPDKTMGVVNAPGTRIVSVAPYQSGEKLKGVLAHEMAHLVLRHEKSTPENESAADEQAVKWGFTKVRSK